MLIISFDPDVFKLIAASKPPIQVCRCLLPYRNHYTQEEREAFLKFLRALDRAYHEVRGEEAAHKFWKFWRLREVYY